MAVRDTVNALTNWTQISSVYNPASADQAAIESLIDAASWWFNRYTDRSLLARSVTEYHDGPGGVLLYTKERPINSVTSLHDDPDRNYGATYLITTTDYVYYGDEGKIVLTGTSFSVGSAKAIQLIYNGGYSTVPYDLENGVVNLVLYWYDKYFQKRIGLSGISDDVGNRTYVSDIPAEVKQIADSYRRYTVL